VRAVSHVGHIVAVIPALVALLSGRAAAADPVEGDPGPPGLPADATLVYVGTGGRAPSKGIYAFRLQTRGMEVSQNITLVPLGLGAETPSPSYLELDARRRLLFAVNEIDSFEGKTGGAVSAFAVDGATGKLRPLGQRASMGARPCHLALDRTGRHLLVANCAGGNVAVLPVAADGRLGAATSVVAVGGGGARPAGITLAPDNQFAFACAGGTDKVMAFRFDAGKGTLAPGPAGAALKPGTGPRRLVFRPDGRFAYVLGEKSSTVTAFAYDARTGGLRELQALSTLPDYYDGPNTTGELGMHPSGKWVYVANRGHNSVVLLSVDADKGTLAYVEEQGSGGKTPAGFGIEPSAKHLALVNQDTNQALAARIDGGNGRLKPSGVFAEVPNPTCVKFLPPKETGK
jgi:6-phosphogluconolactonase